MWHEKEVSHYKNFLKASTMAKVKITLVRSTSGQPKRQKATIEALGLKKLNQSIIKEANPATVGMIKKVEHLLSVEEA